MLLAFDVGNTNIVMGVFDGKKLVQNWRMKTDKDKSADEYGMLINELFTFNGLKTTDVSDVIISTVVPSISYTLQHLSIKYFNIRAIEVGPGVKTGMVIKYDNPKTVGADRIVNAVAAFHKYGGPLIVIDIGTATTFCCITANREYLGGTIAPGIKISSDALFEKTAKLPRVELMDPGHSICRNTIDSIQAGLVYGQMGMIDFITKKMKKEYAEKAGISPDEIKVIATGGLSTMISKGIESIDHVDRLLTLEGLQIIYEKNKNNFANRNHMSRETIENIELQAENR